MTIVAFSGVRQSVVNASRYTELVAWRDVFTIYHAFYGDWPDSMVVDEEYCSGAGYPVGAGGVPRCHNYQSAGASGSPNYAVRESDNEALMSEVKVHADLPRTGDRTPVDGIVGPYVRLKESGGTRYVRLTMIHFGAECPDDTEVYWTPPDNKRSTCIIEID